MFILCIQLVLVFLSALLNSFLLFSKDYFSNMKLSYDSYLYCISFECHPPVIFIVTLSHLSEKEVFGFSRYNWVTHSLAASVRSCFSHTTRFFV